LAEFKSKFKKFGKTAVFLLVFILSSNSFVSSVYAAEEMDYITADTWFRLPIPKAYNVVGSINNIGSYGGEEKFFKDPQDIFIDGKDNIYIVDSGNKRIVVMNPDLKVIGVYHSPDKNKFNAPEGIFVDDNADTGNSRIVHMSPAGELVEIFTNPESELVGSAKFSPTKLVISNTGYIYVVHGETIMAIDGNNEFRGLYGQTRIGYSLAETMVRILGSEQQKLQMSKRTASSYINVALGKDGMIYATSFDRDEGEIKKLNSIGNNIFRKYKTIGSGFTNPITDFIKKKILKSVVAGSTFKFGEYFDDEGNYIEPIFRDITVDQNGIVTVIEEQSGKIYQYDQEGNMLAAFGGVGEKVGEFSRPSAIAVNSKGRIYVVDRLNNNIQFFDPTEFILTVHEATSAYETGDYDLAYERWLQVLELHENYELAHAGIAKAYYKQSRFKESMKESKLANNRTLYSQAFDEYKYEVLRENFTLIILVGIVLLVAVFLFLKYSFRAARKAYWSFMENHHRKMSIGQGILYSYHALFHPIEAIEGVHNYRDRINLKSSFIIMIIAYIVRIAYIYIVHYPLASIDINDANAIFEAVKLLIIPVTWIIASFAVTAISDGESKISEIAFTTTMGLVPFIFINTPLMFISNLMSKTQQSWYGVFSAIVYIWMIIMFFLNMKLLNNYSFGKTLRMSIITVFVMLVVWLVAGMVYVLSARVIKFMIDLIKELKVNFL
jgi:tetratricopeptide (TPR) repeat protein